MIVMMLAKAAKAVLQRETRNYCSFLDEERLTTTFLILQTCSFYLVNDKLIRNVGGPGLFQLGSVDVCSN